MTGLSGGPVSRTVLALTLAAVLGGCAASTPNGVAAPPAPPAAPEADAQDREHATPVAPQARPTEEGTTGDGSSAAGLAAPRPAWLGTRVLPLAPDGFGERLPTPPELVDRRLRTPALPEPAPPAPRDERFQATISPVPTGVLARSTWTADCPVDREELRYVTVHHFGFDGATHTGELIVATEVAEDVVSVFAALHAARFPLEEVRVIAMEELSAPPTGDGNVTSAFVCRPTVGGTRWSEHAYGRAIDLNPFHNPYVRGDLVVPELASAYVDRSDIRPGMIVAGDAVTAAFAAVGWGWGGDWTGPATDPMHFSVSGR